MEETGHIEPLQIIYRSFPLNDLDLPGQEDLHDLYDLACVAGWDVLDIMHGRSRVTIDPRIPINAGTEHVVFFHRPGRHFARTKLFEAPS